MNYRLSAWHALLQDDVNTKRELRIRSGDSQERPWDIAHPSSVDGRPTFFDVSVTNTLQPGNLNHALATAGVAATDEKGHKIRVMSGIMVADLFH